MLKCLVHMSLILSCTLAKHPHILFILMDDQGYGDIGYTYSTNDVHTPLLDGLASKGIKLNRHYTSWLCTPTRASIMSGRYPIELGIQHDVFESNTEECLNEKELLMPEVVRHNGYATHLVGKWHLGYARWSCMPCMRGFDTALGYTSGATGWITHKIGSYYDFYECATSPEEGLTWDVLTKDKGIYSNFLYNKRVKKIINNHDPNTPLFLYLPMQSVHSSYYAPENYYTCNDNKRCTMQAMLNSAEDLIGDVISYFEEAGLWEDTVLLYASDNGGPQSTYHSNGHLRGYKSTLWEGGVRTPSFIYSLNDKILSDELRGTETDCYFHVADWYQTIIALSGGWYKYERATGNEMPADLDSIDQSYYLLNKDGDTGTCPRNEIMLHIDPVKRVAGYYKNNMKLLVGDQDSTNSCSGTQFYPLNINSIDLDVIQLFNLTADPNEANDISSGNPNVVTDMVNDLAVYLKKQRPLQCQLPTIDGSYPNSVVPYYVPWDFKDGYLPSSAFKKL